jgi:5'-methylthioinosine phosphorylase
MSRIGIIGGTGLTKLSQLKIVKREVVHTPYGEPSGFFTRGELFGNEVIFLARHGYSHHIPPHKVNYRANIWAMQYLGIERILAFAAVGGITQKMQPEVIVIPHQIIDYTYDRPHTFFEGEDSNGVIHIDFTEPYCADTRAKLIKACEVAGINAQTEGVYAATQGPRLETTAEINRLERDGCDIVGMTGMPEAALAKELGLSYASCAIVANRAAGRGSAEITMTEIEQHLKKGIASAAKMMEALMPML